MIEIVEIIKCNACKKVVDDKKGISLIGNTHWHDHEYHEGVHFRIAGSVNVVLIEKDMHFCDFDCLKDYVEKRSM